jgi:hypothetical protein
VPNPILWGTLALLLRFIPYIGSITAGVLPFIVAVAVDPGWSMALWTAALFIVVEGVTGQLVEPLIYGRSTGLSPIAVIFAAIFWGWMWGPIGLLLSTPITLCVVVLGRHIPHLEFFDVLLGDQPALSPADTFYQRLLAGDPDEILEHAETFLKDHTLASYYDEVAIAALRLTAEDIARGAIQPPQIRQIEHDLDDLVRGLETHEDKPAAEPAAQAAAGQPAVLCVAGREPLDGAIALFMAQLLHKHGRTATIVHADAVSRAAIGSLDDQGIGSVCVCCLANPDSPSFLRYLVRRLKSRLPGRPIIIGIWPAQGQGAQRQTVDADALVGSLHEALENCLELESSADAEASDPDGDAGAPIQSDANPHIPQFWRRRQVNRGA